MDRFIKAALASAFLLLPTYARVQEQTPTSDTPLAQALEFHTHGTGGGIARSLAGFETRVGEVEWCGDED